LVKAALEGWGGGKRRIVFPVGKGKKGGRSPLGNLGVNAGGGEETLGDDPLPSGSGGEGQSASKEGLLTREKEWRGKKKKGVPALKGKKISSFCRSKKKTLPSLKGKRGGPHITPRVSKGSDKRKKKREESLFIREEKGKRTRLYSVEKKRRNQDGMGRKRKRVYYNFAKRKKRKPFKVPTKGKKKGGVYLVVCRI